MDGYDKVPYRPPAHRKLQGDPPLDRTIHDTPYTVDLARVQGQQRRLGVGRKHHNLDRRRDQPYVRVGITCVPLPDRCTSPGWMGFLLRPHLICREGICEPLLDLVGPPPHRRHAVRQLGHPPAETRYGDGSGILRPTVETKGLFDLTNNTSDLEHMVAVGQMYGC
jgi:hypothetical protein